MSLIPPVGVSSMPVGLLPVIAPSSHSRAPYSPAPGSSLPINNAPSLGIGAPVSPLAHGAVGSKLDAQLVLSPGGAASSMLSQGLFNRNYFIIVDEPRFLQLVLGSLKQVVQKQFPTYYSTQQCRSLCS